MLFGRNQRTINRLLIVEDEPLIAFDLEHALEQAGYTVVGTVDRYRDAMALVESEPIDLILCDVRLTGERDGIALAREVRSHGIRVLFVTGAQPDGAEDLALGWLAKPYTHKQLLDAIDVADAASSGRRPKRLPAGLNLYGG